MWGFPDDSVSKESACSAGDKGDVGSIPGSGRSPGGRNGNPLQNSCLENPMDGGAWWATVHRVTMRCTRLKKLSTHAHILSQHFCSPLDVFETLGVTSSHHTALIIYRIPCYEATLGSRSKTPRLVILNQHPHPCWKQAFL